MKRRVFGNRTAEYYSYDEKITNIEKDPNGSNVENADYIFVDALTEDISKISFLKDNGFCFHDRLVLSIIDLSKIPAGLGKYIRYDISEHNEISNEVIELAIKSYPKDRRFHFETCYDDAIAKIIIRGYLRELSDEKLKVYHCEHNRRVVGFVILRENDNIFENILGAVDIEYQNRGAAMSLYAGTLISMKEKGFRKYEGWISTKNIASLNLHTALGARFVKTRDRYIYG